jgi:hypothetical protein
MGSELSSEDLERLRRSIAMLGPGQSAGLSREQAMQLLRQVERLQKTQAETIGRLRHMLGLLDGP